ncbi:hypothetical protein B0A49_07470, partial [Cryomyces minteri]
ASLSLRLVPNQEANEVGKALVAFLTHEFQKFGSNNELSVTIDHQAEPWLGDFNNQIFQTLEQAIMDVWGPVDDRRRRSSLGGALKPSRSGDYFGSRPLPATSSTLANGSAATPKEDSNGHDPGQVLNRARKPLYIREGGSIPAIRFLEKEFGAPAAHFPCGQASDSAHLDNERFRLLNLYKSKDIFKKVFRDLPQK